MEANLIQLECASASGQRMIGMHFIIRNRPANLLLKLQSKDIGLWMGGGTLKRLKKDTNVAHVKATIYKVTKIVRHQHAKAVPFYVSNHPSSYRSQNSAVL